MTDWDGLNPAKVALCGDWHANQHYAKRAIEYAKEQGAEAILHVGDFGYTFEDRFIRHVQYALEDAGLTLGFVDGNHEDHQYLGGLVDRYGITPIPIQAIPRNNLFYLPRTYRWTWNGVSFLALGGAHSADRPWRRPGIEWWPDETISWQQAQQACDDGAADVMITHDVPDGVFIPSIQDNPLGFPATEIAAAEQHRELLRQIVDQVNPKCLFAGHYHCRLVAVLEGTGYQTVVNILHSDSAPVCENTVVVDVASFG